MSFDPVSRLDGKVAVITGGLGAIGYATAAAPGGAGRELRAAAPQGRRRRAARRGAARAAGQRHAAIARRHRRQPSLQARRG